MKRSIIEYGMLNNFNSERSD